MGTTPSFQTPSFMNTSAQSVAAPDYQGAVNSNYQAQMQQSASKNNALGGILGSVAGAGAKFLAQPTGSIAGYSLWSDERLKEDINPLSDEDGESVLMSISKMPVSEWQYKPSAQAALGLDDERHMGPMAADYAEEFEGDGSTIDLGDAVNRLMMAMKAIEKRTSQLRPGA